jgi:hypothetical protein
MVNTFQHDRKVRQRKQAKDRKVAEHAALFRNALKALKMAPIHDIDKLSRERQIALLTDYVARLDADIAKFDALYADSDGRSACIVIRRARSRALNEISKLMIGISRGDKPVQVPQ